ncbi:MAG: hypothetical protein GC199_04350 [Alphaproteobacteria bacterium]|nr:hypothetical protein [Alphaproteobacteria bacterium]
MSEAFIKCVQLAAAHDGEAELIITLEFENGGRSLVTLDECAARNLLEACGIEDPDALTGTSWVRVRDALAASSARFTPSRTPEL